MINKSVILLEMRVFWSALEIVCIKFIKNCFSLLYLLIFRSELLNFPDMEFCTNKMWILMSSI